MYQVLISLLGISIVYRNLSLLEKFKVITYKKMFLIFVILQIPFFLFYVFKDQFLFTHTYIGIFLLTLIFYRNIFELLAKNTYVKCHLGILDHLILLLKSGHSAQQSLKIIITDLTIWQKTVFKDLESVFSIQTVEKTSLLRSQQSFFSELKIILNSNHKIIEQLISFREAMKIKYNLRHKSRQVTQQIRAQAVVAVFIYVLILLMSLKFLQLNLLSVVFLTSILLFVTGFVSIFLIGGRIKWKT